MGDNMKILVGIWHPAHVHFFRNFISVMEKRGHIIKVISLEKEIDELLMNKYNIKYESIGRKEPGIFTKMKNTLIFDKRVYYIAKRFKPDVMLGIGAIFFAHAGKLLRIPSIIFSDSEPVKLFNYSTLPFTDTICTPLCFKKDLGKKQIRYNGYHELAYLHPNWFKPNPDVLNELGVSKDEDYVILRFSAFDAYHDIGIKGFSLDDKRRLVRKLEKYARVFVSSEVKLSSDFERYIKIPPHRMHDALYHASLLVGDTQTTTTEAACLGTPAIRCNSFVGPNDMSNFIELEQRYGLIFNYREPKDALEKALELIQQPDLKREWKKKRENLLKDKIDVTAFMTWFIENYPQSFQIMKENPEYQKRFK